METSRLDPVQMGVPRRNTLQVKKPAAPTVALESVFITSTIDANESRKVVTIDIPGAFLHANNDDCGIMRMVRMLAELMVKTNPYRQYIVLEKREICTISMIAEGSIWTDEESITILQEAGGRIARDGV
jgi:hypothetical protein